MRIYLAGPMRGRPEYNFPEFFRAAAWLEGLGHTVVNPAAHDMERGVDPTKPLPADFDLRETLLWDMEQLSLSDAVALLEGWEDSLGARAERALASALQIPCYTICGGDSLVLE